MAKKLTDGEREAKTARIKELEEENSELTADVALIRLERDLESANVELQTKLDALETPGGD